MMAWKSLLEFPFVTDDFVRLAHAVIQGLLAVEVKTLVCPSRKN